MSKYKISEICDVNANSIKNGYTHNEILYLDTANLTEGNISNLQKLNIAEAPSRAKRLIKENTILYSSVRPNLKHYGIMKGMPDNVVVSTGFITLDVKDTKSFDPDYVYYLLTQPTLTEYLQSVAQNGVSAYPSINPSDLTNIKFDFPSYETQVNIASVLSNLDKKIALNRQINDNLEDCA